jgi:putative ABC transport system ATP-binding protein
MIIFRNVTLTYPDGEHRITALDDVNLTVPRGNVTAITGASGSGKSSLLAVGSTLTRPDSGSVLLDDEDISAYTQKQAAELRRDKIGIIFQSANLIPSLTAVDQLVVMKQLNGSTSRSTRKEASVQAHELLAKVGLTKDSGKRPHQLSGGQRQRVNIARALMNNPSLLVVDEPTSALDSKLGADITELIVTITKDHNTATLLVTHDKTHLPMMDAVTEMRDGTLTC